MMDSRLKAIYDELPDVPCTGRCADCCSYIGTFPIERRVMRSAGRTPPRLAEGPCPWLDFAGRCSAHELRPLICRIYGASEELKCPHGCVPERWLSPEEVRDYMTRIEALLADDGMRQELPLAIALAAGLTEPDDRRI